MRKATATTTKALLANSVLTAIIPSIAFAQDASGEEASEEDVIVVTARKREEDIQR